MPEQIHAVDLHVGARLRALRKARRISQSEIARALGLTFQQVQKYENGSNRISASKLFDTARALAVPVSYFFDDFGSGDEPAPPAPRPLDGAALEIGRLCEGLTARQLKAVRDLAATLGGGDGEPVDGQTSPR